MKFPNMFLAVEAPCVSAFDSKSRRGLASRYRGTLSVGADEESGGVWMRLNDAKLMTKTCFGKEWAPTV